MTSAGCKDVQTVTNAIKLPANKNNRVKFQVPTAPDMACETGTRPALANINKLMIRLGIMGFINFTWVDFGST